MSTHLAQRSAPGGVIIIKPSSQESIENQLEGKKAPAGIEMPLVDEAVIVQPQERTRIAPGKEVFDGAEIVPLKEVDTTQAVFMTAIFIAIILLIPIIMLLIKKLYRKNR